MKEVMFFPDVLAGEVAWMCAAPTGMIAAGSQRAAGDVLAAWAEGVAGRRDRLRGRGCLRFAFYGRASTEDWQDPELSRARQLAQAQMLTAGRGVIAAEFFDTGYSRVLPWARRPQAAALVAQLADPDRGWDAIVVGEYERAFYGSSSQPARFHDRHESRVVTGCAKDGVWRSCRSCAPQVRRVRRATWRGRWPGVRRRGSR